MNFIIAIIKVVVVVFLGVVLLYIMKCIQYNELINFISFIKETYPYAIFAVLIGMLAKEKIEN
ncbi:hypothetical protein BKG96_10605 [Rodentibacter caecimuris]|uniref:Uncharacterized protein n=1 Tax=Rodentibacter caecimuris TaxID=1796644 RepID=A0A1V3KEL4_9PAST|nr:hypothetical protein [Rodentibacter heylii]OOF75548.1 hypothetical protein BKG96_10605 [Rodentibacter heylii]